MSQAAETSLWEEIAEILRHAALIWGRPKELLEEMVLPRCEAQRLAAWVRALEAAARALLAAMAARLPKPAPGRPGASTTRIGQTPDDQPAAAAATDGLHVAAQARPCTDVLATDPPDRDAASADIPDSALWSGVAFRFPRASSGGGRGGAPAVRRLLWVRGLAFRLEALARVAAAPEAYARRLARRLDAEPGLARRLTATVRSAPGRTAPYEELTAQAQALAQAALGPLRPQTRPRRGTGPP